MESIESFVEENGLSALLDEVDAVRSNQKPAGGLAEEKEEIKEDEWFQFLRSVNDTVSPAYQEGPIPAPSFNYLQAQRLAVSYVDERTGVGGPYDGVPYGDIVEYVAHEMDADPNSVNQYLEAGSFKETDEGLVTAISFD